MTYDYYRRVRCPLCGRGEMLVVNAPLARCTGCKETLSYGFFNTLRQVRKHPESR